MQIKILYITQYIFLQKSNFKNNFVQKKNILNFEFFSLVAMSILNTVLSLDSKPRSEERYYPLCSCAKDGSGFVCPENDGHKTPASKKLVTSDIIQDISNSNPEKFLLYTTDEYRLHR